MSKYIIYCHTLNNKRYIGYSSQTLEERLEDHIKESIIDKSERHFHRAIRKYGVDNITSVVLDSATTRSEATFKERYYITELDTFKNGYNMTLGGDGGNTKEKYTEEEMNEWRKSMSINVSGMKNGNARPDVTVDAMIEVIINFVQENNLHGKHILQKDILNVLKSSLNISIEAVKRRTKNVSGLMELVIDAMNNRQLVPVKYEPYYRSEEQRKHLAKEASGYGWVTNGVTSMMMKKSDIDEYITKNKTYKKGRTL